MKKKLKTAYFGEHDLKNFTYCIDSSIQNNLVREELSKKIHKLQGVFYSLEFFNSIKNNIFIIFN